MFLLASHSLFAQEEELTKVKKWYVPDLITVQYAGNIGFLSTGIGYTSRTDDYQASLLYGYVPKAFSARPVHSITFKNVFHVGRFDIRDNQIFRPYLGLGLTVETGGIAYLNLPSYYPDRYYAPKALHFILFGGLKLQHFFSNEENLINGLEIYIEGGTIDQYIWYKANSSQVKFTDIFSMALGINAKLR
jgi:hypothetical protein